MPRNTLGDLNNHLFAQLERLSDEGIKGEELQEELKRAHAVTGVAREIIANGKLVLEAKKFEDGKLDVNSAPTKMLEG